MYSELPRESAEFVHAVILATRAKRGLEIGTELVRRGVEAYSNRNPDRVPIPEGSVEMMAGFSIEAILGALGEE